MWVVIVVVVVVVLVVLWAILSYNGLVRSRSRVDQSWSGIDVQLRRRYDLIPNLVETVKGYAKHERETLEAVMAARQQGLEARDPVAAGAAQGALTGALGRLFAVAEAYPELKADRVFLELQEELTATEDKIAYARQFYNDAVQTYDVKRQSFPATLVARMAGGRFPARPYFEIGEPEARGPVQVRF
jgi:LemA protein